MSAEELISCPGVLALELAPGDAPSRLSLERDEAEQLAAFIAEDLRELLPGVEQARLAVVGAHFDSTELLRSGFPVVTTLTGLAERLDGGVIAFGARDGHMPAQPLAPDPALAGGALRLLPWTLIADADLAERLGPAMETELVGRGEAGTRTADFLMRTLGMRLEHLRYFSRNDLMALVCVHYEHVNLAALWELIEATLLSPERAIDVLSAHGLAWHYRDGQTIAQTPGAWLTRTRTPPEERAHALAGIVFELRQYVAMLAAHRIEQTFESGHHDAAGGFVVDSVAAPDPSLPPAQLHAHEAPGLGVMALSVAQPRAGTAHVLAHAWLLSSQLEPACRYLADRFGCSAEPEHRGRVTLDDDGRITIAGTTAH